MKIEYLSVGLLALFSPLAAAWSKEGMFYFYFYCSALLPI
jgi:hypothetical protein